VVEAEAHQHRELVDIGRLVGQKAGLADADQRRVMLWCAPPSGARVTPAGVATIMNRASW
jgi:hypothetical protein